MNMNQVVLLLCFVASNDLRLRPQLRKKFHFCMKIVKEWHGIRMRDLQHAPNVETRFSFQQNLVWRWFSGEWWELGLLLQASCFEGQCLFSLTTHSTKESFPAMAHRIHTRMKEIVLANVLWNIRVVHWPVWCEIPLLGPNHRRISCSPTWRTQQENKSSHNNLFF